MKRIAAITFVLLVLAVATGASETSWGVGLQADNGSGMYRGPVANLGVDPLASDLHDDLDGMFIFGLDLPQNIALTLYRIPGEADAYGRDVHAPSSPAKVWNVYIAAEPLATYEHIQLSAYPLPNRLPPAQYQGTSVRYSLTMVDSKGVVNAPANGTRWNLPIPTAHSASAFWVLPVSLPTIKLSAASHEAVFAEGYHLRFAQEFVPEPSSLLALGACLSGLIACAIRRRRG